MSLSKTFKHLMIPLEAIKLATNNFAKEYRIYRERRFWRELLLSKKITTVAMKRLDPKFGQGNPEFWKEIITLSRYKHENITSLLGFCDESGKKIIVYEYALKKSLDLHLGDDDLTWIERLKICIGMARGLAYLHDPNGTNQRVLHRDIKSANILLDDNWIAKISDLGLSKFSPANQQYTFLVSNTVGTIGYCDPVYVETGFLTKEADVYSFGVVLFEVLCGRLCISNKYQVHGSLIGLNGMSHESLNAFTTIAYRCLNRDLQQRPLMTEVVKILESALEYQYTIGTSHFIVNRKVSTRNEHDNTREEKSVNCSTRINIWSELWRWSAMADLLSQKIVVASP
ncbi:hypothetical protein LXL04_004745 [Taraxacum kok-saghyz]